MQYTGSVPSPLLCPCARETALRCAAATDVQPRVHSIVTVEFTDGLWRRPRGYTAKWAAAALAGSTLAPSAASRRRPSTATLAAAAAAIASSGAVLQPQAPHLAHQLAQAPPLLMCVRMQQSYLQQAAGSSAGLRQHAANRQSQLLPPPPGS